MLALERLTTELGIIVVPLEMTALEARPLLDTGKIRLAVAIGGRAICDLIPSVTRFSTVRGMWVQYQRGVLVLAARDEREAFECLTSL